MVSKGKHYRDLRVKKIRNCINLLMDLRDMNKTQLDLIPLVFLKKLEKDLTAYTNFKNISSKYLEKKDNPANDVD